MKSEPMERRKTLVEAVAEHWAELEAGGHVKLSLNDVQHPRDAPEFTEIVMAWPVGQVEDFAWSHPDGSRVHAQIIVHDDGSDFVELHRDQYDPAAGVGATAMHMAIETPLPTIALVLGIVLLLGALSDDDDDDGE